MPDESNTNAAQTPIFTPFLLNTRLKLQIKAEAHKTLPHFIYYEIRSDRRFLIKLFIENGAGGNKSFTCFVGFVFGKVLNESSRKVFGFVFPNRNVGISIARV